MNKKSLIRLILALLVLVVLLVGYFLIRSQGQKADEASQESNQTTETNYLLDESIQNQVFHKFSYQYDGKEVILERRSGDWYYLGDEDMVISSDAITQLLAAFVTIETKREITDADDLSAYGFDEPANVLTYETENGDVGKVLFGDINTTTGDLYVMLLEGDDKTGRVYTASKDLVDNFDIDPKLLALTESE